MESVFGLASVPQSRIPAESTGQAERSGQTETDEAPEESYEATIVRLDHTAAEALFRRAWMLPV
jgi:hypothetical protein